MTFSEASKKFNDVYDFLRYNNNLKTSYFGALNAIKNFLAEKAAEEKAKK